MLSRFHLIPERHGQTNRRADGRTDRIAISISRVSVLTRDKNAVFLDTMCIYIPGGFYCCATHCTFFLVDMCMYKFVTD